MKRNNFFVKLKNNIYNIKTFSEYVKEGLGRAILYAFMLSIILGGIQGIYTGYKTQQTIQSSIEEINNPQNEFSIKDSVLHTKKSPVKVDENGTVIYLDSSETLNGADTFKDQYVHGNMYVLLLKDGIMIGSGSLNKQVSYKDAGITELNNEMLDSQLKLVSSFIIPVVAIATIAEHFINYILNCLIISAFAILIGTIMGLRMKGSALYSMSVYAATLPSILLLPFSIVRPDIYFDIPFIMGTVIYTWFILRDVKQDLLNNRK